MVGRGRSGHTRARGGAPVPERRRCDVDGSLHWDVRRIHREMLAGLRAGRRRRTGARASASTRGRSTTGCSMPAGTCSATRTPTATRRTDGVAAQVLEQGRRRASCTPHRPAAAAVQHDLPALSPPGHAGAGAGRDAAAAPGPAGLLAHRQAGRRAHQRLDDRAVRRAGRASGPPSSPSGSASLRDPAAAAVGRRADRAAAARRRRAVGLGIDGTRGRGRVARHRLGRGRRARPAASRRRTSPPAPGRWSASSSTSRC